MAAEEEPMPIRAFRRQDAAALAELSAGCLKGETDFVLCPLWESEDDLFAEFDRFAVAPEEHLLVAEDAGGRPAGLVGFLRRPGSREATLVSPVVARDLRGKGLGGDLLRAALELGAKLGVEQASAAVGTRNRSGYALLTGLGFQPQRQHFMMRCEERPALVVLPVEGLTVEAAKPADAAALLELYAASGFEPRTPARMEEVLADGIHQHALARRGDQVVAFCEIETHWPRRVWVAYVGVAAPLRNRGVGSAVVAWALQRQFDGGCQAALQLLSPANRPAVRAYQKVGFHLHRTLDVLERKL
jgi:ribosomal protein S18 acetylase RimI-like enzyme